MPNRSVVGPCVVVAVATFVVAVSGLRGADYPAHLLRAALWERSGFGAWNMNWYGGHPTPSYSVLGPPLISLVGPLAVITFGSLVGTASFARLVTSLLPNSSTVLASYAFAVCCIPNVVVGRAPFAIGLGVAIAALWAWRRGSLVAACALAAISGLFSPVAAVFLLVATGAVLADAALRSWRDREWSATLRPALIVTVAAALPIAILGLLFGSAGRFPFRADQLVFSLVVASLVALLLRDRVVTLAVVVTSIASIGFYLVPNPMGGNFLRLVQHVGVPLAVTGIAMVSRRVLLPLAAFLAIAVGWTMEPGVVAALQWAGDESVDEAYHQPLIDELRQRNADGEPLGRVEIPFTDNHWESLYVALEVPYARGWERQLDLEHNEVLYDDDLTLREYRQWLDDNGVRWIALADVAIDEGGLAEWELLQRERSETDIPWLEVVWANEHWQLFEVADHEPIVGAPARLVRQGVDDLIVTTPAPATVTIRFHYDEGLSIDEPSCLEPEEDGWIVAHLAQSGVHRITIDPDESLLGDGAVCGVAGEQAEPVVPDPVGGQSIASRW